MALLLHDYEIKTSINDFQISDINFSFFLDFCFDFYLNLRSKITRQDNGLHVILNNLINNYFFDKVHITSLFDYLYDHCSILLSKCVIDYYHARLLINQTKSLFQAQTENIKSSIRENLDFATKLIISSIDCVSNSDLSVINDLIDDLIYLKFHKGAIEIITSIYNSQCDHNVLDPSILVRVLSDSLHQESNLLIVGIITENF